MAQEEGVEEEEEELGMRSLDMQSELEVLWHEWKPLK